MPDGRVPAWAHGPAEVFRHADQHFRSDGDTDRRLALIGFDNAIEVCVDTFVGLHPRHRRGYEIRREDKEPILRTFHTKVEFVERYAVERGLSLGSVSIDEVVWYHLLRNELYHSGNGMTPERRHLVEIREAARSVFQTLFDCEVADTEQAPVEDSIAVRATTPEPPDDASERLGFLSAYIGFEQALSKWFKGTARGHSPQMWGRYRNETAWAAEFDGLVGKARQVRNTLVHGGDRRELGLTDRELSDLAAQLSNLSVLVSTRGPVPKSDARVASVNGRALARVAHDVAVDYDADRAGLTALQLVDMLVTRGVAIGGDDPPREAYKALNAASDLFERGDGGTFIWLVPEPRHPGKQRAIRQPASSRDLVLVRFWTLLLPRLAEAVPIFATTRPRPYPFITKSVRGTTYRVNIKRRDASVWVMVRGATRAETIARFERLRLDADEVRAKVGRPIGLATPEGNDTPFAWVSASKRGLDDEAHWDETIRSLVDVTARLFEAVQPLL